MKDTTTINFLAKNIAKVLAIGFVFSSSTALAMQWDELKMSSHIQEALTILDVADSVLELKHDISLPFEMWEARRNRVALEKAGIVASTTVIPSEDVSPSRGIPQQRDPSTSVGMTQEVTQIINQITNYTVKAALTETELVDLISSSETLKSLLKGEKGDPGPQGATGAGITYVNTTTSVGSVGGITYFSSQDISTKTLTVTSSLTLPTGSITSAFIADGSITFTEWSDNLCTADQIPKYNGTAWACATDAGGVNDAQYLTLATNATLSNERVLAGTSNQVILTDGGANGNLTLSLPQNIHTGATPTFAGVTLNNTGLKLNDIDASHTLTIAPGSNLTTGRTLTITTADTDRTITLSGNPTLSDWFDQNVKTSASPTFAGATTPAVTGGTAVGSTLTLKSTSGVGSSDAIIFQVGNNGATEAMRIINSGNVGIGTATPANILDVAGTFNVGMTQSAISATGGTITTSGSYTVHTFTSSGTFTPSGAGTVEYLVVAGGGGGGSGNNGAGGGAGGMRTGTLAVSAGPMTVTIGVGGLGEPSCASATGGDSVFGSITSKGGGRGGGGCNGLGGVGGSGGGAAQGTDGGMVGTWDQGNDGGDGSSDGAGTTTSGGGGGAGAVGGDGSGTNAGVGGAGRSSSISGSSVTYAGGGGGTRNTNATTFSGGAGGAGGGGAGASTGGGTGTSGTANRGGGGGGGAGASASGTGGDGGSGIVIVRYLTSTSTSINSIKVNSIGNIGVGNTTPLSKLGLLGNISIGAAFGTLEAPVSGMIIEGNVGIGNSAPETNVEIGDGELTANFLGSARTLAISDSDGPARLYISGQTQADIILADAGAAVNDRHFQIVNMDQNLTFRTYGQAGGLENNVIYLAKEGRLGVAMITPSVALDVTGDIEYTGTITDVSDARLKENITDFADGLAVINAVDVKSYNMIGSNDTETGFIAQNVNEVFPQAVSIVDPDNGYMGVSYVSFVPVLTKAIQELDAKLTVLETASGQISPNNNSTGINLTNIKNITSISGKWSIDDSGLLVAEKIKTKIIEIEEGITIKDKTNGQFYCVYFDNGILQNSPGACDAAGSSQGSGDIAGQSSEPPVDEENAEDPPVEEPSAETEPESEPAL